MSRVDVGFGISSFTLIFIINMEKQTRSKIIAINEAINEELEALNSDFKFRIGNVIKLKNTILELLDAEDFVNSGGRL